METSSAQPSRPLRAVLYARLSRESDASTSIKGQDADLRALAASEGWHVVAEFADEGKSGGKRRENADEAVRMLESGEVDVLAAYAVDRFSRLGIGEDAELVRIVRKSRARTPRRVVFIRENIDSATDPKGWALRFVIASEMAHGEREVMVQRRTAAISRMRNEGRYVGLGAAPYGYRSAPNPHGAGRVLVIDPAEADVVRDIAGRLLDGHSATAIARDLVARRVPSARSAARLASIAGDDPAGLPTGAWNSATLGRMMQSQHLLGRITTETTRKTGQEDLDDDNAQNLGRGESRYGKSVRGHDGKPLVAFEPVLDLSTFLRLGERFTRNAGRGVQVRRKAARLGSGLVYCGLCGSKAYVVSSRGRAQYRCSAPSRGESNKCGGMSAAASIVEDGLRSEYLGMLGHLPAVLRVETLSSPEVDTALATVSEQLRTEAAELIRPGADVAAGAARVAELQAERDRLIALPRERRIEEHDLGGTWADVWERSDLVSQRRYLGEAFEYFTMHPAGEPRRIVGVIAESEEEDHGGESTPRDPSALRRRPRSERKATA